MPRLHSSRSSRSTRSARTTSRRCSSASAPSWPSTPPIVGAIALRHRLVVGLVGIGLFGVIGVWASASRRAGAPWHAVLPSVLGAAAGIGALLLRATVALERPGRRPPTGDVGRREFLRRSGTVLGRPGHRRRRCGLHRPGARAPVQRLRVARRGPPADRRPSRWRRCRRSVQLDVAGITPFVTPNADFYRIDTALTAPQVQHRRLHAAHPRHGRPTSSSSPTTTCCAGR